MALIQGNYLSACLKRNVTFNALLPVDPMFPPEGAQKPLKTLYLLHGYTGGCSSWLSGDELGELSQMNNLAIIMPDGENHFYVDDLARGDFYGEMIGRELVDFTRKIFPLSHARADTIIGGISMGGFGALRNGLKYSETFGHIVAISPAMIIEEVADSTEAPNHVGATRGFYRAVFGDPETCAQTDRNPKVCARQLVEEGRTPPSIYIACGYNDMLVYPNRDFSAYLSSLGIEHVFEEGPGSHENPFFQPHLRRGLARLDLDRVPEMPNPFWVDGSKR